MTAQVLMATLCNHSLGGEGGGHKHEGCVGRRLCWKLNIMIRLLEVDTSFNLYQACINIRIRLIEVHRC